MLDRLRVENGQRAKVFERGLGELYSSRRPLKSLESPLLGRAPGGRVDALPSSPADIAQFVVGPLLVGVQIAARDLLDRTWKGFD